MVNGNRFFGVADVATTNSGGQVSNSGTHHTLLIASSGLPLEPFDNGAPMLGNTHVLHAQVCKGFRIVTALSVTLFPTIVQVGSF